MGWEKRGYDLSHVILTMVEVFTGVAMAKLMEAKKMATEEWEEPPVEILSPPLLIYVLDTL